ncbi:MAG: type II secretion system F family protein [Clostridiaceae bacterium]|nr:type II secretion system F family protein [Clostridiaceae bacterium]
MVSDKRTKLDPADLAWLCEQIALVQRSGILLPEGIALLAESADVPRLKKVLKQLSDRVSKLMPLSDAMQEVQAFPPYLVRMVRIGELSGNLDKVLTGLADFYLRDNDLRQKVRNALVYPLVLLLMMLAIIVLLIVRVLPVFDQVLGSFGGQMPPVSQGLLHFGQFISRHAFWLIPTLVVVAVGVWLWFRKSAPGRRLLDQIRLRLPVLGTLYRRLYASRFALSMHYLLRSGIDLDSALSMTQAVMDNSLVSSRIDESRQKIRSGSDTFVALQETGLFPRLFVRMLALGSRAGELDTVMSKIAQAYENEVNNRLTRLTGMVEPLLVIILSLVVGIILLTVMMPLVEIMSSIG